MIGDKLHRDLRLVAEHASCRPQVPLAAAAVSGDRDDLVFGQGHGQRQRECLGQIGKGDLLGAARPGTHVVDYVTKQWMQLEPRPLTLRLELQEQG